MPFAEAESPDERDAFYARIARHNLAPLWEALGVRPPPHPAPACLPALWRYRDVRPALIEAARLARARESERRALVLENPGLRGASSITHGLYAGWQPILPGEVACPHRHTAWSLRMVIEGEGSYIEYEGERTALHAGDLLVTPPWSLLDYGNAGDVPVVWLDGMEIPTVKLVEAALPASAEGPAFEPTSRGASPLGGSMLRPDEQSALRSAATVAYPYARTREALARIRAGTAPHASHGFRMHCPASAVAEAARPAIGAFIELLPAGFRGRPYRTTDGTVYCVVEGRGESRVGDEAFAWEPHDVFVVPSWCCATHKSAEEAVLIGYSEWPAQQALGLWREEMLA
jgi:gentisate 1,2-dioxygenase